MSLGYISENNKYSGRNKLATRNYLHQRVTAFFMIPLCFWFAYSAFQMVFGYDQLLLSFIMSPFNMTALLFFLVLALYHGYLGVQNMVIDYIHDGFFRKILMLVLVAVTVTTIFVVIMSIMKIHFSMEIFSAIQIR